MQEPSQRCVLCGGDASTTESRITPAAYDPCLSKAYNEVRRACELAGGGQGLFTLQCAHRAHWECIYERRATEDLPGMCPKCGQVERAWGIHTPTAGREAE